MAEETLLLLVGYTDWWLTGNFLSGSEPKAAMALMSYMMWLMPSLFSAIAIGAHGSRCASRWGTATG